MNESIRNLLEHLRGTSAGTKVIALLAGVTLIVVIGVAGVVSKRPDYQLAFSGLTDHEVAKVNKALAQAGIPFTSSSPPGPFNVYVDEAERSQAFAAAYGAGALDKPLQGILSQDGVSSVFNSAEERRQGVRKKEWQEMERMLESLEFVLSAYVRTSPQSDSPIRSRGSTRASASVVLRTRGALTQGQENTIAKMVSNGLGVRRELLVISDHEGNTLFDGSELTQDSPAKDHLEQQLAYDARLTERANELLSSILGPDKARVTVTSEWNYEQSTSRSEASLGKGALLEERKNSSDRPLTSAGDAAGLSSNLAQGGGPDPSRQKPGPPPTESTSEESKTYLPAMTVEEKVNFVPKLERLVVALYLDEGIAPEKADELTATVKASVGFDESRKDQFSSVRLAFFTPEAAEDAEGVGGAGGEDAADAAPNPMMETLLRRGVELLTAGAFLVLLLRTLKNSKAEGEVAEAEDVEEVDPEVLARARVDELMKNDPDRVGELLSSWALEEQTTP